MLHRCRRRLPPLALGPSPACLPSVHCFPCHLCTSLTLLLFSARPSLPARPGFSSIAEFICKLDPEDRVDGVHDTMCNETLLLSSCPVLLLPHSTTQTPLAGNTNSRFVQVRANTPAHHTWTDLERATRTSELGVPKPNADVHSIQSTGMGLVVTRCRARARALAFAP